MFKVNNKELTILVFLLLTLKMYFPDGFLQIFMITITQVMCFLIVSCIILQNGFSGFNNVSMKPHAFKNTNTLLKIDLRTSF